MAIPSVDQICPRLADLKLTGAGECDGRLLLLAEYPEKAADALRSAFGPPLAGHTWTEFIEEASFEHPDLAPFEGLDPKRVTPSASPPVLQAGDKIGRNTGPTGTLGGIVFDSTHRPYLLAAWHSTPLQNIHETDSGRVVANATTQIGTFATAGHSADCLVALSNGTGTADPRLKFGASTDRFQPAPAAANAGDAVELCGAIAERTTEGTVLCPHFCVLIKRNGVLYKFDDQILTRSVNRARPFAQKGDSGGIVLRRSRSGALEALGLHHSTSQNFSLSVSHPLVDIFRRIQSTIGSPVHF